MGDSRSINLQHGSIVATDSADQIVSIYAGTDYGDHANDDVLVIPMIETAEALENLEDILSVPGIDAVYVGPSDLSLALGCQPRLDQTDAPPAY